MLIDWFRMYEDANRVWFTSDHHFGHANIIKFCNRPYADADEMDRALIDKWNGVVGPDDIVFHLGDFTLGDGVVAERYFRQLHGRIFVLSNPWHHDRRWLDLHVGKNPPCLMHGSHGQVRSATGYPVELLPPLVVMEISWTGEFKTIVITLCHSPLAEWDRKHYGAWLLHGHSHGKHSHKAEPGEQAYILDVGVDVMNGCPINLGGVLELMYGMGWS